MTADPRKSAPAPEADEAVGERGAGELESELDEARRRAEEYLNDLRRVAADFDNYRKRVARDSEAQAQRARESIVSELLPVLDNLERARRRLRAPRGGAGGRGRRPGAPAAGRHAAAGAASRRSRPRRARRSTRTCTRRSRSSLRAARGRDRGRLAARLPARRPGRAAGARRRLQRPRAGGGRGVARWPTTTRRSACPRARARTRSRRPTASSPASYHPDRNPGDAAAEERFKEIGEAYDDAVRPGASASSTTASARTFRPGQGPGAGRRLPGLRLRRTPRPASTWATSSAASSTAAAAARPPAPAAAAAPTSRRRSSLSFEDALHGVTVQVPVDKANACPTCHGSGAAAGHGARRSARSARAAASRRESQGFFSINQPCARCGGAGTVIEHPCPTCHGSGRVRSTKTYQVRIPAGVRDGTRIKVKGKGEAAPRGGEPGDLYVVTRVTASPLFTRSGDDLVIDVPVTFAEAAIGGAGRAADAGRRDRAGQGAGRLDRRQDAAREGPRRADAERRRPAATCSPALRIAVPIEAVQAGARGARAPAGDPARPTTATRARSCSRRRPPGDMRPPDDHPRYSISVAAELAGMHPQTLRIVRGEGPRAAAAHPGRHPPLLRPRRRAPAQDRRADRRARPEPGRRQARARPRGRDRASCAARGRAALRAQLDGRRRGCRGARSTACIASYRRDLVRLPNPESTGADGLHEADRQGPGGLRIRPGATRSPGAIPSSRPTTCCWRCSTRRAASRRASWRRRARTPARCARPPRRGWPRCPDRGRAAVAHGEPRRCARRSSARSPRPRRSRTSTSPSSTSCSRWPTAPALDRAAIMKALVEVRGGQRVTSPDAEEHLRGARASSAAT